MKNHVVLLAGGIGKRMQVQLPKQFLEVEGKPIIVYSIENFQRNLHIEDILIVCVKEWIERLKSIVTQFALSKVRWIIEGGDTGHDSIRNGILFLRDKIDPEDYVVIHDAVRPVLPQKAINEVLRVAHEKGNASSSVVCHPPIVYTDDFVSGITDVDREHVMLTQAPQAFKYSLALKCYLQAEEENRHDFTYASSLLIHCGERVYFAKGTTCNIKITKQEDLVLFQALLKVPEEMLFT